MSQSLQVLFEPFAIKSLALKNRIVMAPMTRTFSPRGVPGDDVAAYYRRRAENEVGLILSEGTVIERPSSHNHPNIPAFHGAALDAWKAVIDGVHAAGGKMGPQIWHVGSVPDAGLVSAAGDVWMPELVESPSGLLAPNVPRGEAMSDAMAADTIAAFGQAAADAKRLGFDTVEIHAAHGYLLDQFFWGGTNTRTDRFGGATLKERSRFVVEVVRAVRVAVGPNFPIFMRLSQWKQQDYSVRLASTPQEMADWLVPLVEAGVDVVHGSQRRFWEPEFPDMDGEQGLNFAGWAKKLTGAASVSVGSVGLSGDILGAFAGESSAPVGLERLVERMEKGEFDLIAVGRALLGDPAWVRRVQAQDLAGLRDFDPAAIGTLY